MYEDFIPERLAKQRIQKGVSARDMSLSLGQAIIDEARCLEPKMMEYLLGIMKELNGRKK